MDLNIQIIWLFILAIPVACISWTVTHEEVFAEVKTYCDLQSRKSKRLLERKFFYLFTCEYCFSHYVTMVILFITHYTLLFNDWRGYVIAGFSIVWIANLFMSIYAFIKIDIKKKELLQSAKRRIIIELKF